MKKSSPEYPYILSSKFIDFPPVSEALENGLLAIGGDLSTERLINAYKNGIFPWYDSDSPILWWSPDPRFVLFPDQIHISKSLRSVLNNNPFNILIDSDFKQVLHHCAHVPRPGQKETWLIEDMRNAYLHLHHKGYAHSVEVWQDDKLVGGLYGVRVGRVFCGESMFSLVSNASKVALIALCKRIAPAWSIDLIDCQVHTPHLESMGATFIRRSEFITFLQETKLNQCETVARG